MRRIGGITASRLPSSDVLVRLRGGTHGPDEREGDFGTSWPAGPPARRVRLILRVAGGTSHRRGARCSLVESASSSARFSRPTVCLMML